MPPGTPKTRLIRSGGSRIALLEPADRADDVADVEASTSSAMPRSVARSTIPRPAGGGVMKVSSPKFIEPDSTPEMSGFASRPGRPLLDRHVVGAAGRDHRQQVAAGADPVDHVDEQLRPAARRAVVLAHVQVGDRRAGARRRDRRVGDLLGRVRDVRVVLAEDVGAGDGAGEDDRVAVPGAHPRLLLRARQRGALGVGDRARAARSRSPRGRARTRPRPATLPSARGSARAVVTLEVPSSPTPHSTVTVPRAGSISRVVADRAAADHVLVAADPALAQEGVAALLEVGEDDGVVDVAEAVEVAASASAPRAWRTTLTPAPPPARPSASRSGAGCGARARARRRRGRARSRCRRASAASEPIPSAVSAAVGKLVAIEKKRTVPPSAVSRIAAGSQPRRVDDDDGQVGRRRPGGAQRLERRERIAQVGGDADVAEPELADARRPRRRRRRRRRASARRSRRGRRPARACRRGRRRARRPCRRRGARSRVCEAAA